MHESARGSEVLPMLGIESEKPDTVVRAGRKERTRPLGVSAFMASGKIAPQLESVPLRNLKAGLRRGEGGLQKQNLTGGEALNHARFLAGIEPKAIADDTGVSHSLVLRALKARDAADGDLGFVRLWNAMPDLFWTELAMLILKARGSGRVRRCFEVDEVA